VIFSFERNTSMSQARTWIEAFNKQSTVELFIVEPLANTLYMIGVRSVNPAKSVKKLLASSPLKLREHNNTKASTYMITTGVVSVLDRTVSVNAYSMFFEVENPQNFKHLVYFQICKGNHGIFCIIEDLFCDIGKVVHSFISTGEDLHRIVVLFETTFKEFPNTLRLKFDSVNNWEVPLEIIDCYPRCHKCFSQLHSSTHCPLKEDKKSEKEAGRP
jgi:hypothetical protein